VSDHQRFEGEKWIPKRKLPRSLQEVSTYTDAFTIFMAISWTIDISMTEKQKGLKKKGNLRETVFRKGRCRKLTQDCFQ
jgi:hypothetical protein